MSVVGLSPHARGNPAVEYLQGTHVGSIPARAGQPCSRQWKRVDRRVYPRTRGATAATAASSEDLPGLSPHARGNRAWRRRARANTGSIPARAGQPSWCLAMARSRRVYPRTRGATKMIPMGGKITSGLSPHARGNRQRPAPRRGDRGSIPARAGQPLPLGPRPRLCQVYPRTRGATLRIVVCIRRVEGLSPHARGNLTVSVTVEVPGGSIPARAGQPGRGCEDRFHQGVYPRTRGATPEAPKPATTRRGLSPHARGNRCRLARDQDFARSIPARAGQPFVSSSASGA